MVLLLRPTTSGGRLPAVSLMIDYVDLCRDSAIQASLMALAAPSIDDASEVQGECRAELARAMLSRSLHSQCISNALQRYKNFS